MALGFLATLPAFAGIPDLLLTFEESPEERWIANAGSEAFPVPLPEGTRISGEAARFGQGGLEINRLKGREDLAGIGWQVLLGKENGPLFQDEIQKMTIATWVRPTEITPITIFWRLATSTGYSGFFQFAYLGHDRLYFQATGPEGEEGTPGVSPAVSSRSPVSLQPGEWNHLAMTFNNGEVCFYANGEMLGQPMAFPLETLPAQPPQGTPSLLALAGVQEGTHADDFALFGDRALSPDEIRALYENGLTNFLENTKP